MLLILVGLGFFIWWLVRQFSGEGVATKEDKTLQILKGRYARGEISKEEFEQIKKDLTSD
jgi:putative membrane protein